MIIYACYTKQRKYYKYDYKTLYTCQTSQYPHICTLNGQEEKQGKYIS